MAIVPLLLISTKVMMAIRIRGRCVPPISSAKTSLGFGHGSVVDIRTVMYDSRKQPKMKVSLRRKIHIMAFPQDALLNARWSEDQSETMDRQPAAGGAAMASRMCVVGAMSGMGPTLSERTGADRVEPEEGGRVREQAEKHDPDHEEEMPVRGAQLDAQAQRVHPCAAPQLGAGLAQGGQTAQHVQAVDRGDQVEERVGRSEERRVGKECRSRWSPYH